MPFRDYINDRFQLSLGCPERPLTCRSCWWKKAVHPDTAARLQRCPERTGGSYLHGWGGRLRISMSLGHSGTSLKKLKRSCGEISFPVAPSFAFLTAAFSGAPGLWSRPSGGQRHGRKFSIRPIRTIGKENFRNRWKAYQQLIRTGHDAPRIQYNLGNGYFRMNQLGRAILAYERAQISLPRDADLNFNLAHARDQVVDAIPPSRGFFSMAFFWLPSVSAEWNCSGVLPS